VQFFDALDSRVETIASFLRDGLEREDAVVVALTKLHWGAVSRSLSARNVAVESSVQSGQLTVLDADGTLSLLLVSGRPDAESFDRWIGALLRRLAARQGSVRVYGELVDLLAARGEPLGALQLESLWNALMSEVPFTLLCGYSSQHFGDAAQTDSLQRICRAHSHVRSNPRDLLATFLIRTHVLQPAPRGAELS
jgi:hypothetical protein